MARPQADGVFNLRQRQGRSRRAARAREAGRETADELLLAVATRLGNLVRPHDTLARIGQSAEIFEDYSPLQLGATGRQELDQAEAEVGKTRAELRQIGVRDEAARLSGVGRCGREYCCSTCTSLLSAVSSFFTITLPVRGKYATLRGWISFRSEAATGIFSARK